MALGVTHPFQACVRLIKWAGFTVHTFREWKGVL